MDIEFHYYMTYLIAARAGFPPAEAAIVAQAAQEIDDNHIPIAVNEGTSSAYLSAITQTMNILQPHHTRKVYPIFHFIPGEPDSPGTRRKDRLRSGWVTTPNSPLANELIDTALRSKDLYRIGASAHAFADSWAHQNFVGGSDVYNEMPAETFSQRIEGDIALLRIGHALAGHQPDIPALIWNDDRLVEAAIDNTERFMDAAYHLFRKLYEFRHGTAEGKEFEAAASGLLKDLRSDIGPSSTKSVRHDPMRIQRYRLRALEPAYGGTAMPDYVQARWADEAFVEKHAGLKARIAEYIGKHTGFAGDILEFGARMQYSWADPEKYRDTHWYRFQEGVKAHLDECWGVLKTRFPELKE
jgi:hypothetical protein